jgi:hypothetical protein
MYMIVEKNGNATAFVSAFNGNADNSQVEEKLRRATEKVMERNHTGKGTEVTSLPKPIIIHEGNDIIVSGIRYRKVEEPPTLYDKLETWMEYGNFAQSKDVLVNEILNIVKEIIPEPFGGMGLPEYFMGYNECIRKIVDRLE